MTWWSPNGQRNIGKNRAATAEMQFRFWTTLEGLGDVRRRATTRQMRDARSYAINDVNLTTRRDTGRARHGKWEWGMAGEYRRRQPRTLTYVMGRHRRHRHRHVLVRCGRCRNSPIRQKSMRAVIICRCSRAIHCHNVRRDWHRKWQYCLFFAWGRKRAVTMRGRLRSVLAPHRGSEPQNDTNRSAVIRF